MSPRLVALSLSLFVSAASLIASPPDFSEPEFRFPGEGRVVARGLTKNRLVEILGLPTEVVAPDTWIYRNFDYPDPLAVREGYDTLIVGVVDDRVTVMKLVSGKALDALLKANAEARAAQSRMLARAEPRPRR